MKLILEVARNIPGAWAENVTLNMINFFKHNCHLIKRQGNQLQDIIFRGRGTLGAPVPFHKAAWSTCNFWPVNNTSVS